MSEIQRETLEVDVLFVGGGPAGLAGAYHLSKLAEQAGRPLEIALIDKSAGFGDHGISGAVLDPVALRELMPDYREQGCPIERDIGRDEVHFLTSSSSLRVPHAFIPPYMHNLGFHSVSLGKLVAWLAGKVEERGVYLFTGTTAAEVLYDGDCVAGVRTGDKGLDKDGQPRPNFEPGSLIRARVTVFCEGPRGTVTEDLIARRDLRRGRQPQIYSLGCKEVIRSPAPDQGGLALHTLGWPLPAHAFGGGFFYELGSGLWSVGFVAALDWQDPGFDCFEMLQHLKKHPLLQRYLKGGEVLAYGAKTIPEGGYFSIPQLYTDGALIAGDAAGLVDVKRLKGIPHAMKSGMLAAGTALEAVAAGDLSAGFLERYWQRLEKSWVVQDLWTRRNFRSSFKGNLYTGLARMFLREVTGGGASTAEPIHADHRTFRHAREFSPVSEPGVPWDRGVILDKLTAVFKSGTKHREDQPSHIRILDPRLCIDACLARHGTAPCTHFCPAQVYELVGEGAERRIQVNFSNCVHCKTCGILDPVDALASDTIQNIEWRAPAEGGPQYKGL